MKVQINRVRPGDWVTIEAQVFDTDPGDEDNTVCVKIGGDRVWLDNEQIMAHHPMPKEVKGGQADDAG